MADVKPVFKSKKAEEVYQLIINLPPLTDEQARKMVKAIERVTGRRHPVRPIRRSNVNP
ncbi:MAG: hypothetical protein KatS3mg070_0645 [Meiothermus sp.]|uniref:hypothetical protein n=1 Tax=Meiothermus sp. TaxID=1955249 RepID=UPI0021DD098B|nr:hypothetical protein [Meiothermus sp.]GIW27282.1 MAG: hypothetical protein KatS3mg070_0645 [Meiothermus sp.]